MLPRENFTRRLDTVTSKKKKNKYRGTGMLPAHIPERSWREVPRNAKLTKHETLSFFREFIRAEDLPDDDAIERCSFLTRHVPPDDFLSLRIESKFVQLVKRLEKVNRHSLCRDHCLQPNGVVWRTGEEIEAAGRDRFPEDVMSCTIKNDLFKLWPLLSFVQGIGTLHQVDG